MCLFVCVCVLIRYKSIVFADVPGLLEGAHTGIGLGQEFLRHCERCNVLVQVIDGDSPDPLGDFHAIRTELELFSEGLSTKPFIVAINKIDIPEVLEKTKDLQVSCCCCSLALSFSLSDGLLFKNCPRDVVKSRNMADSSFGVLVHFFSTSLSSSAGVSRGERHRDAHDQRCGEAGR